MPRPALGRAVPVRLLVFFLAFLGALAPVQSEENPRDLLVSTHVRLDFLKEVSRYAVADPDIVAFQLLSPREGLVLGRSLGRTTVMVWFGDGTTQSYLFHVRRDLSLLEEALREVHASIVVSSAPDRDAVVLRGVVPDISYANAAEEMAQRYLDAKRGGRRRASPSLRVVEAGKGPGVPPTADPGKPPTEPTVEPTDAVPPSSAVINLIRVESLPGRLEDRIQMAVHRMGAVGIQVTRLVRGRVPSDDADIFLMQGTVRNQTTLIRALSVAQSMIGASSKADIVVRADESGALAGEAGSSGSSGSQTGSGQLSQLFGGGTTDLRNLIDANVGRAKVIEAAGGRILSFVEVTDLPQVRVDIRLYEVNCTKLRSFNSDFGIFGSNFRQGGLNPAATGTALQGPTAPRVGSRGENPDVQNVLGFLGGTLSNQLQISGDYFALDSLLSLLEQKGFARSLSRPSLTVLSGERAFFQVGGEVPIPQSLSTNVTTDGILNSIVFRPFGVQLTVRPLVGENGEITLDVAPQISLPDAALTAGIRESTGSAQTTTSFRTRSLQTTAKLDDGQSLLLGGLITRNISATDSGTPGLSRQPVVGGLFSGYEREGDEFQLVVVVHPVVLRKQTNRARMWAFPELTEHVGGR